MRNFIIEHAAQKSGLPNSWLRRCLGKLSVFLLCLGLGLGSSVIAATVSKEAPAHIKQLVKELHAGTALLVDVREVDEWQAGHIEAALLVPLSGLRTGADVDLLAEKERQTRKLYLYCRSGNRVRVAKPLLLQQGYQRVIALKEGFNELRALGLVATPAGLGSSVAATVSKEAPAHIKQLVKELHAGTALLVDVREVEEWEAGHIEAALLVPLSGLQTGADVDLLAEKERQTRKLYLYCRSGNRVRVAKPLLQQQGYQRVIALKEGFNELRALGLVATPAETNH